MKCVILESPYAGNVTKNVGYAQQCMRDSLLRGEAPMVSHLLYTQVLDDKNPEERKIGMEAGWEWLLWCDAVVVYTDLGISPGMEQGILRAKAESIPVEYRSIKG